MSVATSSSEQQLVGVQWRLDVPLASRECPRPTVSAPPQFVIAINTNSAIASHGNSKAIEHRSAAAASSAEAGSGAACLSNGAVAANSPSAAGSDNTIWASCDVETAVNITKGLEDALGSLWSSGYRRINKQVK